MESPDIRPALRTEDAMPQPGPSGRRSAPARADEPAPALPRGGPQLDAGALLPAIPVEAPHPAPDPRRTTLPLAPERHTTRGLRRTLLGTLRTGIFGLALYTLFFHLSVVRGRSMAPGIHDGDRILVEPWSYALGEVERGDVVVLQYPLDPSLDYIKRVIGLPGDRVTMAGGRVWVNGELLDEPYVTNVDRSTLLDVQVGEESYFVLGDNRPRSSDSREFGQVPAAYIRGRVDVRLWPPSRVGWIR